MLEIKKYSDWVSETTEQNPEERIRKYTDYFRIGQYKNGVSGANFEIGLSNLTEQLAQKEGLLGDTYTPEEAEEVKSRLEAAPAPDADRDALTLLNNYESLTDDADPEAKAKAASIRRYLTLREIAPEIITSEAGLLDSVNALVSDRASVMEARRAAVRRGDAPIATIEEEDGTIGFYSGPELDRNKFDNYLDSMLASGAIRARDIPLIEKDYLRPLFGGRTTQAELQRASLAESVIGNLIKNDDQLRNSLELEVSEYRKKRERDLQTTGEKIWSDTLNYVGAAAQGVFDAGAALLGAAPETRIKPTRGFLSKLAEDKTLNGEFSSSEIQKFGMGYLEQAIGTPYRPDRPGSGIAADLMGRPVIANDLVVGSERFQQELEASGLDEEQRQGATAMRVAMLEQQAPELAELIAGQSEEGAAALAVARSKKTSDSQFVEEWFSTTGNYSGFAQRAKQLGATTKSAVVDLPLGIGALLGDEGSVKAMVAAQTDQQSRRRYARMFGDEFGLVFEIANTVPQVGVDIIASIGTGGIYTTARTAVLKGGTRAAVRAAAKSTVSELSPAAAALARTAASPGGEASLGAALRQVGEEVVPKLTKIESMLPTGVVAFTRSAGASYASIYSQQPESMTHEEKHKASVGYAIGAGIGTALTVLGMGFLGRGGVESAGYAGRSRIRPTSAADDLLDDATLASSGARRVDLNDLNYKQAKRLYEINNNAAMTVTDEAFNRALRTNVSSAWKNYFRQTLKGGFDEGLEEAIDQNIQIRIEDAALDRETPLAERISQTWHAFTVGAALGGVMSAVSQLASPLNRDDVDMAMNAQMSLLSRVAKDLRMTNSPASAEVLARRLREYQTQAADRAMKAALEREEAAAREAAGLEQLPTNRYENDMEEGVMFADLANQYVYFEGKEGVVQIDKGEAYFIPQKRGKGDPKKLKEGEGVARRKSYLGPARDYAAGVVTNLPSYPVDESRTPYLDIGNVKYRLPTAEEVAELGVDQFFDVRFNDEGKAHKILLKGLPRLDGAEGAGFAPEANEFRMNRLAARYGLDLSDRPVEVVAEEPVAESAEAPPAAPKKPKSNLSKLLRSPQGQGQFDFIEGRLPDAPVSPEEQARRAGEEFVLEEAPPEPTPDTTLMKLDEEIATAKRQIKAFLQLPNGADAAGQFQLRLEGLEEQRATYVENQYDRNNSDELISQEMQDDMEWDRKIADFIQERTRGMVGNESGDFEFQVGLLDQLFADMLDNDWADDSAKVRKIIADIKTLDFG